MRALVASSCALWLAGCGGEPPDAAPRSAAEVVREWGLALRRGDLDRACDLMAVREGCADALRELRDPRLTFDGPAATAGEHARGERAFSFSGARTLFVTAVPRGGSYTVRVEASVAG